MPRYITIPYEEVELVNYATGRRMKRQSDKFESGGGPCSRCGELNRALLEEDPAYSMIRWLESFILIDQKLQVRTEEKNGRDVNTPEGVKVMKCISAIRKAFKKKEMGDEVILDEPHWERIKELLEKPGNVWPMTQMAQFDIFFEAWMSASDEPIAERLRKAEVLRKAELEKQEKLNGAVTAAIPHSDSADRTTATSS